VNYLNFEFIAWNWWIVWFFCFL